MLLARATSRAAFDEPGEPRPRVGVRRVGLLGERGARRGEEVLAGGLAAARLLAQPVGVAPREPVALARERRGDPGERRDAPLEVRAPLLRRELAGRLARADLLRHHLERGEIALRVGAVGARHEVAEAGALEVVPGEVGVEDAREPPVQPLQRDLRRQHLRRGLLRRRRGLRASGASSARAARARAPRRRAPCSGERARRRRGPAPERGRRAPRGRPRAPGAAAPAAPPRRGPRRRRPPRAPTRRAKSARPSASASTSASSRVTSSSVSRRRASASGRRIGRAATDQRARTMRPRTRALLSSGRARSRTRLGRARARPTSAPDDERERDVLREREAEVARVGVGDVPRAQEVEQEPAEAVAPPRGAGGAGPAGRRGGGASRGAPRARGAGSPRTARDRGAARRGSGPRARKSVSTPGWSWTVKQPIRAIPTPARCRAPRRRRTSRNGIRFTPEPDDRRDDAAEEAAHRREPLPQHEDPPRLLELLRVVEEQVHEVTDDDPGEHADHREVQDDLRVLAELARAALREERRGEDPERGEDAEGLDGDRAERDARQLEPRDDGERHGRSLPAWPPRLKAECGAGGRSRSMTARRLHGERGAPAAPAASAALGAPAASLSSRLEVLRWRRPLRRPRHARPATLFPGARLLAVEPLRPDAARPAPRARRRSGTASRSASRCATRRARRRRFVFRTQAANEFGHDRRSDRMDEALVAWDLFNRTPEHVRALDVGAIGDRRAARVAPRHGRAVPRHRVGRGGALRGGPPPRRPREAAAAPLDLARADALAGYLARAPRAAARRPAGWRRAVRDLARPRRGDLRDGGRLPGGHPRRAARAAARDRGALPRVALAAARPLAPARADPRRLPPVQRRLPPGRRRGGSFTLLDASRGGAAIRPTT